MNVFNLTHGEPWAIKRNALDELIAMVGKTKAEINASILDALGLKNGADALEIRDGAAIINIDGPISRGGGGLLALLFGGASTDSIGLAFEMAMQDPGVDRVVLNVNSPGGTVDGVSELAQQIFASRGKKPITAYVSGDAASAAYWIASAADRMVVTDTGAVGSIGVYASFLDDSKMLEKAGVKEITVVSSLSPKKVPDPSTEDGRAQIQARVDAIAEIFVSAVAKHRGVSVETVAKDFGQGDIVTGAEAVRRGMADAVGNFVDALAFRTKKSLQSTKQGVKSMDIKQLEAEHPEIARQLRAEGADAERSRIQALDEIDNGEHAEILKGLKFDGKTTAAEAALLIVKAQKEKVAQKAAERQADGEGIPAIKPEPAAEPENDKKALEAMAKGIAEAAKRLKSQKEG